MFRLHHFNDQTWCVLCLKRVDTGPFKGPFGLLSVKSAHIDKIRTFSQGKTNRHHALYKTYYITPKTVLPPRRTVFNRFFFTLKK